MRTSRKAKDAAAGKQSYVCDTFTGHGKAHQPPLPVYRSAFPVMLLGKADEDAAVDLMRGGGVACAGPPWPAISAAASPASAPIRPASSTGLSDGAAGKPAPRVGDHGEVPG